MYKLRSWININNINWIGLSLNPDAIHLLEKNKDENSKSNQNTIHLLEKNVDKKM